MTTTTCNDMDYLAELRKLSPAATDDSILAELEWGVSGFRGLPALAGSRNAVLLARVGRLRKIAELNDLVAKTAESRRREGKHAAADMVEKALAYILATSSISYWVICRDQEPRRMLADAAVEMAKGR